jgi:adenine deaminase
MDQLNQPIAAHLTTIDSDWIKRLPKAELHLHIEGSLEPKHMFELAARNGIKLPYKTVDDIRAAYEFTNLQSFLDIYYAGASVLCTEQDFYDLTWAYYLKAHDDGVIHVELFFDPQTHTARGIDIGVPIRGIRRAQRDAEQRFGISGELIMCFLRHLSETEALSTLEQAKPYLHELVGVGLDSSEVGHPPAKFVKVFAASAKLGLRLVAHAGEEGPPQYVWDSLEQLKVERIDHGVRSIEDAKLMHRLAATGMPLTVCPLSNLKLKVFERLEQHNLKQMLNAGVCVTINADDPSYFGGYIADNYIQTAQALGLNKADLIAIARNSLSASFAAPALQQAHLARLDGFIRSQTN